MVYGGGKTVYDPDRSGPNFWLNSYRVDRPQCGFRIRNIVPFLTTSQRKGLEKSNAFDTPGPNEYFPKLNRHVPGVSSLRSKTKRFSEFCPAPHDTKEKPEDKLPVTRLSGYMYHCSVPYTILGYAPTIPVRNHRGYTQGKNRELIMIPLADEDLTLGPAKYRIRRSPNENFNFSYKACHWSLSKTKRFKSFEQNVPGPGSYEIGKTTRPCRIPVVAEPNLTPTRVLRYLDEVQETALRNGYPSPNAYFIRPPVYFTKGKDIQKFNSTAERFPEPISEASPAPNQYDITSRPTNSSRTKEYSAFLTNAPRFPCKRRHSGPAPNRYSLKSFVDNLASRISPYSVKNCAFDSSEDRKFYTTLDTPAPNAYVLPNPCVQNNPCAAAFAPESKASPEARDLWSVSPASYNVMPSFNLLKGPRSHRKVKRTEFLSTTKRFSRVRDWPTKNPMEKIPASNEYNLQNRVWGKNAPRFFFDLAERFKYEGNKGPGPAKYSPSLPRSSFNVTLGKGLIEASLLARLRLRMKGCRRHPISEKISPIGPPGAPSECQKVRTVVLGEEMPDPKKTVEKQEAKNVPRMVQENHEELESEERESDESEKSNGIRPALRLGLLTG